MYWNGREIQLMRHRYNCQINDPAYPMYGHRIGKWILDFYHYLHGVPTTGMRSSERAIEIPLAIDFLSNIVKGEDVLELGCVLPYYILKQANHRTFDLMDTHPENEKRDIRTLSAEELHTNVISISTLEHIGLSDYGIKFEDSCTAVDVLKRIVNHSKRCFVTFPLGHNPQLDTFILQTVDFETRYLTRQKDNPEQWYEVKKEDLRGDMLRENTYCRANTICVIEKLGM